MDNEAPQNDSNGQNNQYGYTPPPASGYEASIGGGKGKKLFIVAGMAVFVGFMLYSIFGGEEQHKPVDLKAGEKGKETDVAKGEESNSSEPNIALPPPPKATIEEPPTIDNTPLPPPELPPIGGDQQAEVIPPPPPPPPSADSIEKNRTLDINDKEMQARIRSNILIMDGGKQEANQAKDLAESALTQADPNRAWASYVMKSSAADKEVATKMNNLNMTIAQGKIINAVLETAIDTELPGTLRAIVSRDTYAESGRAILIPKGSRLIGTYNTGLFRGQSRVMIIWTRLIRPDGIDIAINSPGVDGLGRAGVNGYVDNRYFEIFSTAILTTALSLGAAVASDQLMPDKSTTTSGNGSTTTTNVSPAQKAGGDAVENLTSISKNVVQNMIDIRPNITVDQGTRINVFVNRDLTFPPELKDVVFVQ